MNCDGMMSNQLVSVCESSHVKFCAFVSSIAATAGTVASTSADPSSK